jgi:hypothetical protein
MEDAHTMGHFERDPLFNSLYSVKQVWWPSMRADCAATIKSCPLCQRYDTIWHGYHLLRTTIATFPFDHVAIDLISNLPLMQNGNRHLFVMVDHFTKFVLIRPLADKSAPTLAVILWMIFADFGIPRIIQSNTARNM